MKRSKIIVSSLIALTGVTLASSVASTVAWFQYVTRVTAAYTGTTAHCSKMLQISTNSGSTWGTDLVLPDGSFQPITSGDQAKNTALAHLYAAPEYRQGIYANWLPAAEDSYSQFEIWVKLTDVDENYGTASQTYLNNDVYLTNLTIQDANGLDLAKAVRVHYDALSPNGTHKYFLFAKSVSKTSVGGTLDLNNDGQTDTLGYEFYSTTCTYGGMDLFQESYTATDSTVVATDTKGVLSNGTSFGNTSASSGEYLKIKVTIWLEGWALLDTGMTGNNQTSNSSVWGTGYISKSFNVGMTFGVQPHASNE